MAAYRLHYFPESGNSYKLALMLTLCGQDWEPVWTDFGGGVTRTSEWRRQVNEMGETWRRAIRPCRPGWVAWRRSPVGERHTICCRANGCASTCEYRRYLLRRYGYR
jgi:hypothetical protein